MKKLEILRKNLKERGLDSIIVLDELNQHYLSGFAFTVSFTVMGALVLPAASVAV